jgi:GNAT superfamily N-acetyltransferase
MDQPVGQGGDGESGESLRQELLWRIEGLTNGQAIDLADHIEAFPEIEAAFSIPNAALELIPGRCEASLEDGGTLELVGFIHARGSGTGHLVAQFHREIRFDHDCAEHRWLKVEPQFRGYGISSALLLRSFGFYRALGISAVELDAGMETGRWHWARVGFDFMWPKDREKVRAWAREVIDRLGVQQAGIDAFISATQFALMEGNRKVSLAELAGAIPEMRERIEAVAAQNYLQMETRIALGRAVMLTGPGWDGRLDLNGPSYVQFKSYADAKAEEARRLLEGEVDSAPRIRRPTPHEERRCVAFLEQHC